MYRISSFVSRGARLSFEKGVAFPRFFSKYVEASPPIDRKILQVCRIDHDFQKLEARLDETIKLVFGKRTNSQLSEEEKEIIGDFEEWCLDEDGIFVANSKTGDIEVSCNGYSNDHFTVRAFASKNEIWSDRVYLQKKISSCYKNLFTEGDFVMIPGCADGQHVFEISRKANEAGDGIKIFGADFNRRVLIVAACLGKALELEGNNFSWYLADAGLPDFFDFMDKEMEKENASRQVIVTSVQPWMDEDRFLSMVANNASYAELRSRPTSVYFTALVFDERYAWTRLYEKLAEKGCCKKVESSYGVQFRPKNQCISPQYFLKPRGIERLRKKHGYQEAEKFQYFSNGSSLRRFEAWKKEF